MESNWKLLFLSYGMAIMFYSIMAWLFWFRTQGRAKRMIAILMVTVALQYIKDLFLIDGFYGVNGTAVSKTATCLDIVTVPIYGFILAELCRPGWLRPGWMIKTEVPFVALAAIHILTANDLSFYVLVGMSLCFGIGCAAWVARELPRYHRRLKDEYSYEENINLHWLRGVTLLFFFILSSWIIDCIYPSTWNDISYILFSLVGWMVICYFLYKQELVIRDVMESTPDAASTDITLHDDGGSQNDATRDIYSEISERLERMFAEEKPYLEPRLRLVDLAQRLGTNRTYLSLYFNQERNTSFYEFVNGFRLKHAEHLLRSTDYTLEVVAELSGFNSLSTFRRAFAQKNSCSPQEFRNR